MSQQKLNAFPQGAILTAIYILLLLIVTYIPFIGLVVMFFLPIPFLLQYFRHGLKPAILVALACLFFTLIVTPWPALIFTLAAASVGISMAYYYQKQESSFTPLIVGTIAYLLNYLIIILISYAILEVNVLELLEEMMNESMQLSTDLLDTFQMPANEAQMDLFRESISSMIYIFPALIIFSSMIMAVLHHAVNRLTLPRLGHHIEKLPPIREWQLPKSILFYYFGCIVIIVFGLADRTTTWGMLVINLQLILELLLYIQGLSFIAYYSYKKNKGRLLLIITITLTVLLSVIIMPIVRILGIFDLGFGLKKRIK